MVFLIAAAITLAAGAVAGWLLFRRRAPRLTDADLSSSSSSIDGMSALLASRPDLSLHVEDRVSEEEGERETLKDAFLDGLDFRWMAIGGDGSGEDVDEKAHRDITHYMVECVLRVTELYGHVLVCRDASSQEFLGAIHVVPIHSFKLFKLHFMRSMILLGNPVPYQYGKATGARMDAFATCQHEHEQLMKGRPHLYVSNLAVSTAAQGKGVGRFLMDAAKALSRGTMPIFLECNDGNVAFYEKVGMQQKKRFLLTPKVKGDVEWDATPFPYNGMVYEPAPTTSNEQ